MSKMDTFFLEAQRMYVNEGKTLAEISKILNVSERTLSKWKNVGKKYGELTWDEMRKKYLLSGAGAAERLRAAIIKKIEDISENVSAEEADNLAKLVSALKKIEREDDLLGSVVICMEKFAEFIASKYPERKEEFSRIIREFFGYIEKQNFKR